MQKVYAVYFLETGKKAVYYDFKEACLASPACKVKKRSFATEADARIWLDTKAPYLLGVRRSYDKFSKLDKNAIFLSLTKNAEHFLINLTDIKGKPLIWKLKELDEHRFVNAKSKRLALPISFNRAYLIAFYSALVYAVKYDIKTIYISDKKIVSEASKPPSQEGLISLREKFSEVGGKIEVIPDKINPAYRG